MMNNTFSALDAEQALIGCLLLTYGSGGMDAYESAIDAKVCAEAFTDDVCRNVWQAASAMARDCEFFDSLTLKAKAGLSQGDYERMIDGVPTAAHAPEYAARVVEAHQRREFRDMARELQGMAENPDISAEDIQAQHEARLLKIDPVITIVDACDWLNTEPPAVDPLMENFCDIGDKIAIIGASKTRKSFCALQMAICLAAGIDFLAWKVAKPRRVLVVQLEINDQHYWRRVRRMCQVLGIHPDAIGDRLHVVNGRGNVVTVESLKRYVQKVKAELVIVDPLYKMLTGDENSAQDMKPILAGFDALAQTTGATVAYVHHDPKGTPGDRNTRDRGSGSSVLGRDYDACITLTEHRDQKDALVIQALLRNYPPQEQFSVVWQNDCFQVDDNILAIQATSQSNAADRQRGPNVQEIAQRVKAEILTKPWRVDDLKAEIQTRFGVGRTKAGDIYRLLVCGDGVEMAKTETYPMRTLIGPPKVTEQEAKRMTVEWRTREL